jgi:macrolide transport system ATP-binding/permease protein
VGNPSSGGHITANERHVTGGYFGALRVPLLAVRFFTDAEDASKPKVVTINRVCTKIFPGGTIPSGSRLAIPRDLATMVDIRPWISKADPGGLSE